MSNDTLTTLGNAGAIDRGATLHHGGAFVGLSLLSRS